MSSLIFKVEDFFVRQNLLKPGEKLAAAVSGGPDSVALLYCLNDLKNDFGVNLVVFHINHKLRGEESDRDEAFVKDLASSLHIPFYSVAVNVTDYQKKQKCSTQVAAREVRYFHLDQLAKSHSISKIAIGHTANDQAETVLMRILKGSGLRGISGIPQIRDNKYVRPFLGITSKEIKDYLNQNQVKFVLDTTNQKNKYLRNQVRNKLIPLLKEKFNPSIVETLCRSSLIFRLEDDFISEVARNELKNLTLKNDRKILILDAARFLTLHAALKRRVLLDAIYHFFSSGRHISHNIIENIIRVIESNISGKTISVYDNLVFKYQYNRIIFQVQKRDFTSVLLKEKMLIVPGKTKIPEIGKELISTVINKKDIPKDFRKTDTFTAFIDYDFSGKELFIRSRQSGDKFYPLGINGHKKLKDYFIDKKIPRVDRDLIPLITNKKSILWIAGYQISELAKIKEKTKSVLKLELC